MSGHKMTKVMRVIKQALKDECVMGFNGLAAFSHITDHLRKKKVIDKRPWPMQVLYTQVDGKKYAAALYGDTPNDVWGVVELRPHRDAYIGDTFKLRWLGHEVSPPKELICE